MSVLDLLRSNKEQFLSFNIRQVVAVCADGKLHDESVCAVELRQYLSEVPTEKIIAYAKECLDQSFEHSGYVLQDVINEFGRRLDYNVSNGLYRGKKGAIGYDGIWSDSNGHSLIVEVKTTDTYRINLNTLSSYRVRLIEDGIVTEQSSVLVVVGREDTGDFESQVRGSRHAWDIRIIGVDALVNLVQLKKEAENRTTEKIQEILRPFEYTRLDKLVDIMFTTAEEAAIRDAPDEDDGVVIVTDTPLEASDSPRRQDRTSPSIIFDIRRQLINAIEIKNNALFIQKGRAKFSGSKDSQRVVCTVSKRYDNNIYWYAYHRQWDEFLAGASELGLFALGCVDICEGYALPYKWIHDRLDFLHTTRKDGIVNYWHIYLEQKDAQMFFRLFKSKELIPISQFKVM